MWCCFFGAVLSMVQLVQPAAARPQASEAPLMTKTVSINTAVCPATYGLPPASSPVLVGYTTTNANGNVISGTSTSFTILPSSTPYIVEFITTDSAGNPYTTQTASFSILPANFPILVYYATTDAAGRVGIGSSTTYTTLPGPVTITATTNNAAGSPIISLSLSSYSIPTGISYSYEYYSPTVIVFTTTNAAGSTITTSTTSAVPYTGAPTVVPYVYTNAAGSIVTGSRTSYLPYSSPAATIVFTTTNPNGSVSTGTSISYGDFIYTPPGVGDRGGIITPYTTTLPNGQVVVQFSTSFPPTSTPASASATTSSAPLTASAFATSSSGSSALAPSTSVTLITTTDAQGSPTVFSSTSIITPNVASSAGSSGSAAASPGSAAASPGFAAASSGSAVASSGSPTPSGSGGGAGSLSSALASGGSVSNSVVVSSTTNSLGSPVMFSSISTPSPSAIGTCTKNTTALAPASSSHDPCPETLGSSYESNNCVGWDLFCTVDFSMNDVGTRQASSLRDCISYCDTYVPTAPGTFGDLPCVAVTFASYNPNGDNCYLKSSITSATYGSDNLDSAKLSSYNPNIANISVSAYSSSTTYSTARSATAGGSGTSLTSSTPSSSNASPGASSNVAPSVSPSATPGVSSTDTDTTTTTTTTSTAPTPALGSTSSNSGGGTATSPSSTGGSAAASSSSTGGNAAASSSSTGGKAAAASSSSTGGSTAASLSSTGSAAASSSSTGGSTGTSSSSTGGSTATSSSSAGGNAGAGASHVISRSAVTVTTTNAGGGTITTTSYSTEYALGAATYTANSNNVAAPDSAYGPCGNYGTYSPDAGSDGKPTVVSTNHYSTTNHAYNLYCGYVNSGDDLHYAYNSSSFEDCIAYCDTYKDPNASQPGSSSAGTCVAANWGSYNPNGANCFLHIAANDIISSDPQYDATDFYQDLAVFRTYDPKDSEYAPTASIYTPCDEDANGTYPNQGAIYNANGNTPFQAFCGYDFAGSSTSKTWNGNDTSTFHACMDACANDLTCKAVTWSIGSPYPCYFHDSPSGHTLSPGYDSAWLVSAEPGSKAQNPLVGP